MNPFEQELAQRSAGEAPAPPPSADPFAAELSTRSKGAGGPVVTPGAPPQTLLGGFAQGFKRGLKNDTALAKGAIGLGLSGLGFESGNEWLDEAIADQESAETASPRAVPSFTDIKGVGDAAMYATETLGENIPTLLGLVATGGVGGAALKYGGRKLVEKGVENRLTKLLMEKGAHASVLGAATGLETGASAVEQKQATGEVNIPLALGAGVAKGALETITPLALGKTLGITDDLAKGLVSKIAAGLQGAGRARILKGVATGAVTEGATESLQEAVDIAVRGYVDKNYDALGPEAAERLLNAGIGGALVGGTISGGVSAIGGEVAPDAPVTIEQLREQSARPPRQDQSLPEATIADVEPEAHLFSFERTAAAEGPRDIPQVAPPSDTDTKAESVPRVGSAEVLPAAENTNAATPGTDIRDLQLGFELLPQAYKDIPARDEVDLIRAPLELAVKRLIPERDAAIAEDEKLNAQVRASKSVKGGAAPFIRDEGGKVDAAINSLLNAGAYARKDRVPTILEGFTEGAPLVQDIPTLAATQAELPPGFTLQPVGNVMLNLKSPEGRTILQVPNRDWAVPLMQQVASADRELWTSGFYNTAAVNIGKMREMGADEFIDTRHVNPRPIKETLNVVKKLGYHKIGPAANMNIKPTKKTKIKLNESSLIADTIKFSKWASWWNTLLQIAQKNPNYTPLGEYVGAVQSEQARQMHVLSEANDTVKLGQRLGKEQLDKASDFLWDLEHQVYKQEGEADRWPTEGEEVALIKKHGLRRETYRMILQMREQAAKHFNIYAAEMQQEALKIVANEGRSQLTAMRLRAEQLQKIENMKAEFFARPRFPFTNIGDYVVEVRSAANELIAARLHETKTDQQITYREFLKKYPESDGNKIKMTRVPQTIKQWLSAPDIALRALMESGFLAGLSAEQKQMAIFLARGNPAMKKRFIHAASSRYGRGVDLLRAFANASSATAANMFKMRVVPKLNQTLAQMDRDRSARPNTNSLGDLITFLNQHMHDLLNPETDASGLRSLAFMWHISFVPASALVNATQVPLTTLPYLGTRFGNIKAMVALQKNYVNLNTFYSAGRLEAKNDIKSKLQSRGIRDGFLDQSFATEIAGLSEGTNLSRMLPGNKFNQTMATFSYYGGFMFQMVEKMNRNVTFNAAVDLALANPNVKYLNDLQYQNKQTFDELIGEGFTDSQAKAFLAGRDAVNRTQFEYSRWNRPRFMKGKIKGTIFTFWLFTQGMLHFGKNSPGAMKYWFTMLAVAGLMGLPGAEDLKDIIRAASQ